MHPSMIPETQDVAASRLSHTTYKGKPLGFPLFCCENQAIFTHRDDLNALERILTSL
uniref:Uncharacterized protein n=1 Tax=Siphoviridae sp. ct2773 TaxID=2826275 RepID=A0A8S5QT04_9CAUD|nr:MAG TPA: hypothetical protein [Siphoviridae sp. ct2773]